MNYIYLGDCRTVFKEEINKDIYLISKYLFENNRPIIPATNITFKVAQFKGEKSKQIDLGL